MDRVLLVIDDIQYAGHLEMTLRKVGFDIETITNEYNMPEKLLTFNPDYVIVKGLSTRVSSMNVGKKLKDTTKFLGKVILIFPQDQKSSPDEFIKLRMDLLLFEPISALRLVTHLLNLTNLDKESILDKLLRLAHTDTQFRTVEAQILRSSGGTIDSEIQVITGARSEKEKVVELNEDEILDFMEPGASAKKKLKSETGTPAALANPADYAISEDYKQSLQKQLKALDNELPLRIESYNRAIKTIDQDLKSGHNKGQTRKTNQRLFKDIPDQGTQQQDAERIKFVKALVKK